MCANACITSGLQIGNSGWISTLWEVGRSGPTGLELNIAKVKPFNEKQRQVKGPQWENRAQTACSRWGYLRIHKGRDHHV